MKKILIIAFTALTAFAAQAQKTIYDANVEVRNVKNFHGVSASGGIDVIISQGDDAVAVSASNVEARERIKTVVENGILKVYYDWKEGFRINRGSKMKVYVSAKTIDMISASGGSDVKVEGTINGEKLGISISGGSDFSGKVSVSELSCSQSGGSDVAVSGKADKVNISASGGSDFNGYDLMSQTCNVDASGGSDVEISAEKEISARLSGASDLSYKGNASIKDIQTSGASKASRRS